MSADEARRVAGEWQVIMQSGEQFKGMRNVNLHSNGNTVVLETSGVPVFDQQGMLTGYRGIDRDITAHEKLQEQFHQSQKMEAVGTLVGGIAHDFNNSLAGITGNLFLAKKHAAGNPEILNRLDNAEQLAFQAANVIKQLLTFSRKGDVLMNPIAMTPFLKEVIKLQEISIPENIDLQHRIDDITLPVIGDINLLQQALINLINNARDAVEHIPSPVIRIAMQQIHTDEAFLRDHPGFSDGDLAHISISDNGSGISSEALQHIFEPFFTTKSVGVGTGLGLAMVFGTIQSHGGVVLADSQEGKGSTFHLYLPLSASESDICTDHTHADDVEHGQGETILLVDDEVHVLSTASEVLQSLGYKTLAATDGKTALELYALHKDEIDLVILDMVMPKMGGIEALLEMRRLHPLLKALFITGYEDKGNMAGEDNGDTPVIRKPYTVNTLSRAIRQQLGA